jgi:hypothetical protein
LFKFFHIKKFEIVTDPISGMQVYESKEHKLQVALYDIGSMSWDEAIVKAKEIGEGWILPGIKSLEIIRTELFLKGIGNIDPGYYWSSKEISLRNARYMRMKDGITENFYFQEDYKKKNHFLVRPVRKLTDDI